jgi:RimJ/RimL family protein N-acetyltransferase
VASDPLIWAVHPSSDRWQEPVFRRYFEEGLASGGALVVVDRSDGTLIGSSRYGTERAGPGEIEIGWTFLARRFWGGSHNAEMKRAMIEHGLRQADRMIFLVGEHNGRSRRAMEKIGGRLTPRTVHNPQGPKGLHVVYAIDREAFAAGPLMRGAG